MTAELDKPKFTLLEIESALSELLTARAEAEEMPEAEREQALAAVDGALAEYVSREVQKADNIIGFCRNLKRAMEAAKEDRDYYAKRAEFLKRTLDRVKDLTHTAMEYVGKKRIDGRSGYLLVKGNGGIEPLVISDESLIPNDCRKTTLVVVAGEWAGMREHCLDLGLTVISEQTEIDTHAIRQALADGCGVPGAHLEQRGSHVEIR